MAARWKRGETMKDFRSLQVWQRSHNLVLDVYVVTQSFPSDEMFGLRSQLRRSAASVPANIAEGCGRGGDIDFARFLQIALGSASETEYHLLLAKDLGYIEGTKHDELSGGIREVKRMLVGLRSRLVTSNTQRRLPRPSVAKSRQAES
jgi:four helix bundle protein